MVTEWKQAEKHLALEGMQWPMVSPFSMQKGIDRRLTYIVQAFYTSITGLFVYQTIYK